MKTIFLFISLLLLFGCSSPPTLNDFAMKDKCAKYIADMNERPLASKKGESSLKEQSLVTMAYNKKMDTCIAEIFQDSGYPKNYSYSYVDVLTNKELFRINAIENCPSCVNTSLLDEFSADSYKEWIDIAQKRVEKQKEFGLSE